MQPNSELFDNRWCVGLTAAVAVLYWWSSRGIPTDDGLIYLRYAFNLAQGYGLVYNPGEYYESNTNFLWTLLLVPAFWLGAEPIAYLQATGIAVAIAVLLLLYDVVRRLWGGAAGLLAMGLLGLHGSLAMAAPSGLAPHLPPLFVLAAMALALRYVEKPHGRYALGIGIALSLLLLTRLDAVLLFGVVWLWLLWLWHNTPQRKRTHLLLMSGLPPLVFAVYLSGKFLYYGDMLPATYYAKAGADVPAFYQFGQRGLIYLWLYAKTYALFIIVPMVLFFAFRPVRTYVRRFAGVCAAAADVRVSLLAVCALLVAVQSLYMLRIGGGYLEFRFMVTVAPFLFILIALAIVQMPKPAAAVMVWVLCLVSLTHQHTFDGQDSRGTARHLPLIEFSTPSLHPIALGLRDLFAGFGDYSPDIKIAVGAGGYIPFYLRFYALEMHGWTNPRVLEAGNHYTIGFYQPGHQHFARPEFMRSLGINLVFGKVYSFENDGDVQKALSDEHLLQKIFEIYYAIDEHTPDVSVKSALPPEAKWAVLPIGNGNSMVVLYLTPNAVLDDFFARKGVGLYDIL